MTYQYTPRGQNRHPCHGCGSTGLHKKDAVCRACQDALERYKQIIKEQLDRGDMRPVVMHERAYALPHMTHERDAGGDRDPIRSRLHELSILLSEPTELRASHSDESPEGYLWPRRNWRHEWTVTRLMRGDLIVLLRELFAAIDTGLNDAHARGFREGKNLLMGLASGRITNDEFNSTAARVERAKEEE